MTDGPDTTGGADEETPGGDLIEGRGDRGDAEGPAPGSSDDLPAERLEEAAADDAAADDTADDEAAVEGAVGEGAVEPVRQRLPRPGTRSARGRKATAKGRGPRRKRAIGPDGRPMPPRKRKSSSASGKRKGSFAKGCLKGCLMLAGGIAVLSIVSSILVWYALYRVESPRAAGESVQVEIRKGEGTAVIAEKLSKAGVVDNSLMFRLQARMQESDGELKPGVYDLSTGMDYRSAIDVLSMGPPIAYFTIAIPEGLTLAQIAKRVEEKTGIPAKEFETAARTQRSHYEYRFLTDNPTKSLEGYLFPKTYRIKEGATTDEIIDVMLKQFGREVEDIDISYARDRGLNFHDVVTIASMVEREAKTQKDRPLVASVIYNRLKRGMRLEIDATVQYLLGNKPRLLYRDLRIDSPYNTYMRKGLPPGPIASPGIAALRAAAKPKRTDYYFYVLTGRDGSHSFASSEGEFLRLKQQAKRGLR